MRIHSYLRSATQILSEYNGDQPFAAWLKGYFSANKKFGSKDRRHVSHLCYSFFRLGQAFQHLPVEERILTAIFLTADTDSDYLKELKPEWNERAGERLEEKLVYLNATEEWNKIFPWQDELSDQIEPHAFTASFLQQPYLYLRLRPGKAQQVQQKLQDADITYQPKDDYCIALPNSTRIEDLIQIDTEAVIQDHSSQQVLNPLKAAIGEWQDKLSIWDCCAASGGKSLLAYDLFSKIELTVSDVRQTILHNLQARFKRAGISHYKSFVADVGSPKFSANSKYDIVICDAPCSGAGTWSRTPEQLYYFKEEKIAYYADLQKRIALNASKAVKTGGYFVYITCSVFRKENEEVAQYLKENAGLQLQSLHYYKGYTTKADTLFVALFKAL